MLEQGLGTPTSTYSHRSRNPLAEDGRPKSIPEAAVSDTAWKLTHHEHYEGPDMRTEKKWRRKATEGAMPTMASQTKAKIARRVTD